MSWRVTLWCLVAVQASDCWLISAWRLDFNSVQRRRMSGAVHPFPHMSLGHAQCQLSLPLPEVDNWIPRPLSPSLHFYRRLSENSPALYIAQVRFTSETWRKQHKTSVITAINTTEVRTRVVVPLRCHHLMFFCLFWKIVTFCNSSRFDFELFRCCRQWNYGRCLAAVEACCFLVHTNIECRGLFDTHHCFYIGEPMFRLLLGSPYAVFEKNCIWIMSNETWHRLWWRLYHEICEHVTLTPTLSYSLPSELIFLLFVSSGENAERKTFTAADTATQPTNGSSNFYHRYGAGCSWIAGIS